MALTSTDETDLILPLFGEIAGPVPFATFLERVRRRTGAEYVAIIARRQGDPESAATEFFAGIDLRGRAAELGIADLYMLEGVQSFKLRPDRVYSVAEFIDHDPAYRARREAGVGRLGIADERVIRLFDGHGITSWMVIAKASACTASDSALLSSLSAYVVAAMRQLLQFERQRIEAAMGLEGLVRAGLGWVLFDGDGRVLLADPVSEGDLFARCGIAVRTGERLVLGDARAERLLIAATADLASTGSSGSRAVLLCDEPRVEALVIPAGSLVPTTIASPRTLALLRTERAPGKDRVATFAGVFALPRREAEFAVRLADGLSISDAAKAMGLTIDTARNYSKRLYARLGASGQPQLVRLVLESCAMLA